MSDGIGWIFPDNNYGPENGLDTGDVETFKKDPEASLAREICQNSIDAKFGDFQTRVEFKLFEIEREKIPGINALTTQIKKCYDYKKDSDKEGRALKTMNDWINKKRITCLRISDFNTTGLVGVGTNEKGKAFYNLTKGSGVSDKLGSSGGSKGIGKFASFVASTTNTIFYYTKTREYEKGYIGISKLRSVPIEEKDSDLMTMGIGYYGLNKKNEPILDDLNLDPEFYREESDFGTDVYLIGFNDKMGWQNDIIAKILDSFMVAIMHNEFEVIVDDIIINKDTVESILENKNIFLTRYKREVKDIRSQYELLKGGEDVYSKELMVGENNKITIYVKRYKQQEAKNANKRCIMVRYPYMKIKHLTGHSYLPYSALCIIHDNDLNRMLRKIENPQHTDWEIKRLDDELENKKKTRKIKKEMDDKIKKYIEEVLKQTDSEYTDVEGAGEFLPDYEEGESLGPKIQDETIDVRPLKRNKASTSKREKAGEDGESFDFGEGETNGDNGGREPRDSNGNPNPNPEPPNPPDDDGIDDEGKERVLKKVSLSGMKYKNIVVDKDKGRFDILFESLYDEENCELQLKMFGEGKDKYPVDIISAFIDTNICKVENGKIVNLKIKKGQKYKLKCELEINELFSSEVILNAYR